MGFFDNSCDIDVVTSLKRDVAVLNKELSGKDGEIKLLKDKLYSVKEEFESKSRIAKNEEEMKIREKTVKLEDEIRELKTKNAVYAKEVEILTKAFENMGFDVKDMKEILNKLVDGIVKKNEINVIK